MTCQERMGARGARLERRCAKIDDAEERQECFDEAQAMRDILIGKCQCLDVAKAKRAAKVAVCKEIQDKADKK